jgi:hypothetical protein
MTESHGLRESHAPGTLRITGFEVLGREWFFESDIFDHYTNAILKGSYKNKMIIREGT